MTGSDYFVGAGVLFWLTILLMDRSAKRRVHEPCTKPKAVQPPYAPGTYAERDTGLTFTGTTPVGILAHRDHFGGMSAEVPGHSCKNCEA